MLKKAYNSLRGGLALSASLLAFLLVAPSTINHYRSEINQFLGTTNTKVVPQDKELTQEQIDDLYPYKSIYKNTTELVTSLANLGEEMEEEGAVLLKNENNALPLDASHQKITLLGTAAYNPHQGGEMGSGLTKNSNTDADTVALINGFKRRGLEYSTLVQQTYKKAGASIQKTTSPSGTEKFSNKEVSIASLNSANADWQKDFSEYNTAVIVLGRASSEQSTYLPGADYVSDNDVNLHQSDALGLNDNERDIINLAVTKKSEGIFDKVIVLINSAVAMEIDEINKNPGVDSIMQIGFPGGYGFYGVADLLMGKVSPSGHLPDTYAVDNHLSPAAQNYGVYTWSNLLNIESNPKYSGKLINNYLVEAEGIYTGYYYYETRYEDQVKNRFNASSSKGSTVMSGWNYENEVTYPFGYGLSYSSFKQELKALNVNKEERKITAEVEVTNVGNYDAKDVVQLYVHTPYLEGQVEKSAIKLIDYGKTKELKKNGGKETIYLEADLQDIASYDSNTNAGSYILDKGNYYFSIGNGAHEALNNALIKEGVNESNLSGSYFSNSCLSWYNDAFDSKTLKESNTGVTIQNQLSDMDLNYYKPGTVNYLSRSDWDNTFPKTYKGIEADENMLRILNNDLYEIGAHNDGYENVTFGADNGLTMTALRGVKDINDPRWEQLLDQITLQECLDRIAFGGTSCKHIESIDSPETVQYDGPNGYNNNSLGNKVESISWMKEVDPHYFTSEDKNYNYKAGVMTNETVIAATFSKEMALKYGQITGNYSIWAHVTILWGAGLNLHRLPYNARNHEYYSEDPILSGNQAASFIKGGNEFGAIICPKHYAFNDTEIQRFGIAPLMTEQKARETELRGFQFAVEKGETRGMMTSLSRCGITAINSHEGIMLNILRNEWGFKGLMSTDAATNKHYFSVKELAHCGVTLTTMTNGDLKGGWEYWTVKNVSKDKGLMADVKKCMLYQNWAIANSNAMNGWSDGMVRIHVNAPYDNLVLGLEIGFGIITVTLAVLLTLSAIAKYKNEGEIA